MGMGCVWASGMLAVLLGTSSGSGSPVQANSLVQQLAQVTPTTIMGQLDENSEILYESSRFNTYTFDGPVDIIDYFNIHTFEGSAGESIIIELTSEAFDTYLILREPNGQALAQGGDYGGLGARIVITLPTTGTYQILAKSYDAGETGQYTLAWRPATAVEIAQATARQRATVLHQEATELLQAGRYQEAIPLAEEVLAIRRELWGEHDSLLPFLGPSLSNLARLYQNQGRYSEAEPLFQETLAIFREQRGEGHPDVATSLNNLALLYQDQGRYGEAEPLFQEALTISREQQGDRHLEVATILNNLASLYQDQGRYGEAEPLFQEALTISREQQGDHHPDVATSLNNLALLYQDQGR